MSFAGWADFSQASAEKRRATRNWQTSCSRLTSREEKISRGPTARGSVGGIPLAILGGPLLETDCGFFQLIERAGGRIALDATEHGWRTLPRPFDPARVAAEPLQELADAYFDGIPDAFRRPDTKLYEWLGRELAAASPRHHSAPLRLVRPLARRRTATETMEPDAGTRTRRRPRRHRCPQPHPGANRGIP